MSESLSPVYANTYEYKLILLDAKQQHIVVSLVKLSKTLPP